VFIYSSWTRSRACTARSCLMHAVPLEPAGAGSTIESSTGPPGQWPRRSPCRKRIDIGGEPRFYSPHRPLPLPPHQQYPCGRNILLCRHLPPPGTSSTRLLTKRTATLPHAAFAGAEGGDTGLLPSYMQICRLQHGLYVLFLQGESES
jgi:hypothetical protein